MNLLLFAAEELTGEGLLKVDDGRLQHLVQVHRANSGDTLRVGQIGGLTGSGKLLSIDEQQAIIAVSLSEPPPPKLPLTLVLALPRPKMLRRILRCVAELGVEELHLINSYRVEKSYWQTPALQPDTVRGYLLQGLEQSRDTLVPEVLCHRGFKPFVEDCLPELTSNRTALLAHPGDYPACPRAAAGPTLLVVGPEGGFIPYEVDKLQAAGCRIVSLGPRILRVENAVTTLVARLA